MQGVQFILFLTIVPPAHPSPPPKKKLYNKIAARSNPNFLKIMFSTCCQRYSLVIKSKVEILLLSLQLALFQLKTCELGESQPCWKPCFRCHLCRRKDVGTPWGFSPAFGGHGPVRKPQREHCPCSHWQVTNFQKSISVVTIARVQNPAEFDKWIISLGRYLSIEFSELK